MMMISIWIALALAIGCHGASHHQQITPPPSDHLLTLLYQVHHSHYFNDLSDTNRLMLVEMIAAMEVDQVTHFIDTYGLDRVLLMIEELSESNLNAAHKLEEYLKSELLEESQNATNVVQKRNLQSALHELTSSDTYHTLPQSEKDRLTALITAVESNALTQYIKQHGYAEIIVLVEDMTTVSDTQEFIDYLAEHLRHEQHHHSAPVVG